MADGWQEVEVMRFLGVESDAFHEFLRNVEDIRLGIQAVQTNTEKALETSAKLVEFYTEQKGMSPIASRATAEAASRPVTGPSEGASSGTASNPPGLAKGALAFLAGGPAGYHQSFKNARRLGHINENDDEEDRIDPPFGVGAVTSGGGAGTSPSSGASTTSPQDMAQKFLDEAGPMTVPRAGEFTMQNVAEQLSKFAAQQTVQQTDPGAAQQWQGTSEMFQDAANQWIPNISIAHEYGSRLQAYGQQALNYGESVQGLPMGSSSTSTNVGPVRLPFTLPSPDHPLPGGSLITGLTSHVSDMYQGAISPGLSSDQIAQIRETLAQQGFNEQAGPITGMANSMFRNLTQLSPDIGMNPEVQSMGVDNLRYAQASVSQLSQTLGQDLVTAANAANVSFSQMASDMQAYGEWSQQNGGTAFSGQQLAQQVAGSTGLPADTFLPMMSSPMTQAMAMTHGGVPPWAMGALPVGQQFGLAMQGFDLAASTVKGMPGATENIDGIKVHTPASAVQAATLNQLYYGGQMKNSVLQKMIQNPNYAKGVQEAGQSTDAFRSVSEKVGSEYRAGIDSQGVYAPTQREAAKLQKDTTDSLSKLHDLVRTEIDPTTGKKVFSSSDRHTLWDSYKNDDSSPAQKMTDLLNNFKKTQAGKIGSNADSSMAKAAAGPQIGLTPQAAKFFNIVTNGSMDPTKIAANSGDGSTVNSVFDKATSIANVLPGSPGSTAQSVENTVASILP